MAENPEKPRDPSELPRIENDRARLELYRPASILRTTEWGLLTITSLVASFAFPPYFIAVLWLAFFNAGGMLWVTHLSESGRLRLRDFEREFSQGHQMEEAGKFREAAEHYATLVPKYQDFPKIAEIAKSRIEYLKTQKSFAFKNSPKKTKTKLVRKSKASPKGKRGS
jgi:hypothetical protein